MANRRSFKTDVSFLEKISMGAIGTQRVFEDLRSQGHNPLELERGSMSFKIWEKTKTKRIRAPDILCLGTQDQRRYIDEIEKLKARDPEVYFAVTVLWKIITSWVYDLEEYG